MDRPWDPENHFPNAVIKDYQFWTIEVSYSQHTLGSFIVFCKVEKEKIADLSDKEMLELRQAMKDIQRALEKEPFRAERFNYWQMGNDLHRLHFHGIPRYSSQRTFDNKTYIDSTWGNVPVWNRDKISPELALRLKNTIVANYPLD